MPGPFTLILKIMEHLTLSVSALGLGVLVAIPVGVAISSNKRLTQWVFSIVSILQTVPSLALLAIIVPLMGIGRLPATIALFIYSLLPILRSTVLGLQGVYEGLIDSATGMGYTKLQVIFQVEIPLAFNVMMSGVRLASVYVLAWATLASYIGAGGLGDYIFTGMNNYNIELIVYGTVPIIVFGLIFDFILGKIEKVLSPKTSSKNEVKA